MRPPPPKKKKKINKYKVLSQTEHRKGAAGYRQGADQVPSDALLHQTGPVCMLAAPGPVRLVEGRLATSNCKYLPGIVRVPLDM